MKRGFTLVEMMAAIAIIALLTILIVPNVIEVRNDMLQRDLEIKYDNIKSASLEWAYDNINSIYLEQDTSNPNYTVCSYVSVDTLIARGYISGDKNNKTELVNPVNNELLNKLNVCVRYNIKKGYENRILEAKIEE